MNEIHIVQEIQPVGMRAFTFILCLRLFFATFVTGVRLIWGGCDAIRWVPAIFRTNHGIDELGNGIRVWGVSKGIGGQMTNGYDKPLHAPLQWRTMESPPRDLDEDALEASIADIMNQEAPATSQASGDSSIRSEFPALQPQEAPAAQAEAGLSAMLRQKWAQLSGAA